MHEISQFDGISSWGTLCASLSVVTATSLLSFLCVSFSRLPLWLNRLCRLSRTVAANQQNTQLLRSRLSHPPSLRRKMGFLIHYLFALFFAFLGRLVFTCLSLVFSSRFIFVFRFYALVVFYVSVSFYVGRSLSHVGFACAPLFIHSPFVFAIFFLMQLHVIVFWIYFSYFLQPPRFRFFLVYC